MEKLIQESIKVLNKKSNWNVPQISEEIQSAKFDIISSLAYNMYLEEENVEEYFIEDLELIQLTYDLTEDQISALVSSIIVEEEYISEIFGFLRNIPNLFRRLKPKVNTPKAPKAPEASVPKTPKAPEQPKVTPAKRPAESPAAQARKQEIEQRRMERQQRSQQRKQEAQQRKAEKTKQDTPAVPSAKPSTKPGVGRAVLPAVVGVGIAAATANMEKLKRRAEELKEIGKRRAAEKQASQGEQGAAAKQASQGEQGAAAKPKTSDSGPEDKMKSLESETRNLLQARNKHTGIESNIDATINRLKSDPKAEKTMQNFIDAQKKENQSLGVK